MLRKTSLYTALTVAVMSTLLLMSYTILQFFPLGGSSEALLIHAPKLTTNVWGVFNPATGELRYGSKVEEVRPIASVSKLFTAYAVLDTGSEDRSTSITWADLGTEGTSGKLSFGRDYTLRELLFPLLIESSNDAAAVIERVLGLEYARTLETLRASEDLAHTTIMDPTGLSAENTSTVKDLAHFYTVLRNKYPYLTDITQLRMYITPSTGLLNNDPLRTRDDFTGGKHGYTPEAGRTFVGTFALPGGAGEVGIVLLGSTNLLSDAEAILGALK